jgi:acetoin utilization deacetylase AcuC-like enzyme
MPNHLVFDPRYNIDLAEFGVEKPFALDRGELVLQELGRRFGPNAALYDKPEPISIDDILLVHSPEYLERLKLPQTWCQIMEFKEEEYAPSKAKRELPALLEDIRLKCGGTLLAAKNALELGLCANLGAGYHHAFPEQGRGYCVLNDLAITVRSLQRAGTVTNVLIVDLDFHQGDGTALIFKGDSSVFTLSVHSQEGWPEEKQESSLDVPIYQNEEHLYLDKTEAAIRQSLRSFAPDLVLFVAGSDPYEKDVLPGTAFIKLSLDQLERRDKFVIDTFATRGIPLASVFAGGYGPNVWEVHYQCTQYLLERSGKLVASQSTQ